MQSTPPDQSLIEYPSLFPIKVMGANVDGYTDAVLLQMLDHSYERVLRCMTRAQRQAALEGEANP